MRLMKFAVLVLVLVVLTIPALAQEVTANIFGTVKDSTGAVITGATVTITNTDQNIVVRTIKTDESGNFSAPLLSIGHYAVTAEAQGFKRLTEKGITLNVNDKRSVNLTLVVGSTGDNVTVEASALQVETQSAQAAGLVSGTQIRELSLNNRNYQQLLTLVPGVASTAADQMYVGNFNPSGQANTVQFSINGARTSQNSWMIDGADNVDRGSNLTLSSFPSVDSIAEFKVLRSNYDAEFGRNGAGQINVVTRSGTNTFHGTAYEFVRNDYFNANSYFNKYGRTEANFLPRPRVRYNNFGWNLGGPVYIPGVYNKNRDKTFFFFNQEFRRSNNLGNPTSTVPTAAERGATGNAAVFTNPVCTSWSSNFAAATCTSTGTSIPTSAWSPLAAAYVKDIFSQVPLPNPSAGEDQHTLRSIWATKFNFREEVLKIDHVFSPRLSVNAKMLRDSIPTEEPGGIFSGSSVPGMATTSTNSPGHNYTARATATITPTLLLEAGYAYNYSAIVSVIKGFTKLENAPTVAALLGALPFKTVHDRVPNLSGVSVSGNGPYNDFNFNHQFFGNLSKIWNAHAFKFGASYNRYRKTEDNTAGTEGTFSFSNSGIPSGQGTVNFQQAWANFLLGHAASFTQNAVNITPDVRQNSVEFFGQDNWRIRPNVTFTYGLRWSIFRQPYDEHDQMSNFDPKAYDPAKAPCINANGTLDVTSIVGGKPVSACNANYDPLNGFYIAGKNSPYGRKVANEDMHDFAPRIGIAWDPWNDGKTSVRAGWGMFYDTILVGAFEQDILSNPYLVNSVSITNTALDSPTGGTSGALAAAQSAKSVNGRVPNPWKNPYTEQYNFDIQRQLAGGFVIDIGYYGSQGHHLIGIYDSNQPVPGAYVNAIPVCSATVTANCRTVSATNPSGYIIGTTTPLLNRIRPFLGYTGINQLATVFNSSYHSMQVQLQKRFSGNSMVNIAYTWSHALTDNQTDRSTAPQNSRDIRGDYGPTQQDRRHIFTANFVYELPWYRSQQGALGRLLGGWQFSGIAYYWTGVPLTVTGFLPGTVSFDAAGIGCLGSSPCAIRSDQLSDPNIGGAGTQQQWFNTAAFTNTPAGVFLPGSTRRGAVRGPGLQRWDLSLFKNIRFTERVNAQLRLESFNTFNHTNFDGVNTTLSSTGSSGFGALTSTRDPRNVQLGVKVSF